MSTSQRYHCPLALLHDGWAKNVMLEINGGRFEKILRGVPPGNAIQMHGPVIPGIANVHSHAFQYAMAGLAEEHGHPDDSFWQWREIMYKLVGTLNPDDVRVIATQLYSDMLRAGYTRVAEFHYLFHDPTGKPYRDSTEMAGQLLSAADAAGIGLTLLPALYSHSGFGGQPAEPQQQRFLNTSDAYLSHQQQLTARLKQHQQHRLGNCFHSLRAVRPEQITEVLAGSDLRPIHLHIAEQQREVADCLAWSGRRPVEWLLDHYDIDQHWCLIHATHLTSQETRRLARSHAVVGLCPSTEANLGDGIFPAVDFNSARGRWGIGSDSHVSLSVAGELRLLEYSQRLRDQQRNRLHDSGQAKVSDYLFQRALAGGNQACGTELGLVSGNRADFLVLDGAHAFIAGSQPEQLLSRWVFAINEPVVRDVYVAGAAVIENYRHPQQESITAEFTALMQRLGTEL